MYVLPSVSVCRRYIHSLGIYHLDLTPSNVLLTRSFRAKIADFGIAKDEEEIGVGKVTVTSGTNDFMPPEAFPSIYTKQKRDFSYYTESFSFGCLVLFMLTHEWPEPLIKTISDHDTRKHRTRTEIERRQAFLDDLKEDEKKFEPLILAYLREKPPTDRPNFHDIHDQLMKMKPKIAVFTDTRSSHLRWVTAPKQCSLYLSHKRNMYTGSIIRSQGASVGFWAGCSFCSSAW